MHDGPVHRGQRHTQTRKHTTSWDVTWNFGPGPASFATVADVAARAATLWGPTATVTLNTDPQPHEAGLLTLDSTKSRNILGWRDKLTLEDALAWTVDWERDVNSGRSAMHTSVSQLDRYIALAIR